jgi:Zn-finger nucleic acid-binding protein
MSDRQGVEIDYCPQCRGVWLDRGELDKIIERAQPDVRSPSPSPDYRRDEYRRDDDDRYKRHYGYRKKREGFLAELFDFD